MRLLCGIGILAGTAAESSHGGTDLHVEILFHHWLHFHMQQGICLTLPCIVNENIPECDNCSFPTMESLYHHLTQNHMPWVTSRISKHGLWTLKPCMMDELIQQEMEGWLKQILPEPRCGLWMMAQADYRTIFRWHW